jgi:tetratricopeptide (TPR) repeat protein
MLGDSGAAQVTNARAPAIGDSGAAQVTNARASAIQEEALDSCQRGKQGNLKSAHAMFERVLAIFQDALGTDGDPSTAETLHNLALVLKSLANKGGYKSEQELYDRALEIYDEALGTDHSHTKIARAGLESLQLALQARPSAS